MKDKGDELKHGSRTAAQFLVPLALFAGVFAVYAVTAGYEVTTVDAHAAMVEAWHIAATGSPWLEGDLTEHMLSNKFIGQAAHEHTVSLRMAGPVLAGVPAYWLLNNQVDPQLFSYAPGALTAAFVTALAVLFVYGALRSRLTHLQALAASVVFALTTPTWTVSADSLWTHSITQMGIAGAAFGASRNRWLLAGTFLGLGMLGRPHLALVAAVVGIGAGIAHRRLGPVISVAAPTTGALALLACWNRWMFGEWSVGGAYDGHAEAALGGFEGGADWGGSLPQLSNYLGFLVAPDRGLLIWTPALVILLFATVWNWRQLPAWCRSLALGGVVYSIAQLRINYFAGGDGFWGYRHGLELLTCLLPALIFSIPRLTTIGRVLLAAVVSAQFAAMTVGAVVTGYSIPIEDVWRENSFWAVIRHQPVLLTGWLAFCVLAGVGLVIWLQRKAVNVSPVPMVNDSTTKQAGLS